MIWTSNPPSVEGYYWLRCTIPSQSIDTIPVRVFMDNGVLSMESFGSDHVAVVKQSDYFEWGAMIEWNKY